MERRVCKRYPVDLEAVVSYPALGLIHAQVLNISPDGIFLSTGNATLSNGSDVELVLLGVGSLHYVQRLNATVTHSNHRGCGLLFSRENFLSNEDFHEMIKLLFSCNDFRDDKGSSTAGIKYAEKKEKHYAYGRT